MKIIDIDNYSDQVKYAYAAGIFNGEGHIGFSMQKRKSGVDYPAVRISITQFYDPEILQVFERIFGYGKVEQHSINKPWAWRYREQSPQRVFDCIEKMWPWLSEDKRSDAEKTKDAYNNYLVLKSARKEKCRQGHDMSLFEFFNSKGARQCRECARISNVSYRERKKSDRLCSPS